MVAVRPVVGVVIVVETTVIVKAFVETAAPPASVKVTTMPEVVPAVVGVPVIAPVEVLRLKPPGRAVPVSLKAPGVLVTVLVIGNE